MISLRLIPILMLGVLLTIAGCDRLPQSSEQYDYKRYHRGRAPADDPTENLSQLRVAETNYPPRALGVATQRRPPSNAWLLDADSNYDRFERLEIVLGGIDRSMWEAGLRLINVRNSIASGDLRLARYESSKIRHAFDVASLMRPAADRPLQGAFLPGPWAEFEKVLATDDGAQARASFLRARDACMSCHKLAGIDFVNEHFAFRLTSDFETRLDAQARAAIGAPEPTPQNHPQQP